MPFETKTLEELVQVEKDEYRARLKGDADLSEGSDLDIEARVHAVAVYGNQAHAEYLVRQILPDTADAANLQRHADVRGIEKRRAAPARGRVHIGDASGSPPVVQPAGSEITSSGQVYTLDEDATVAYPGWFGKTTRAGATTTRIPVGPDVSGMARGHRVEIDGMQRTIIRVLQSIQAIEVSPPLKGPPVQGTPIEPIPSAFVPATATAKGAATNRAPGDVGTLSSPAEGIDPQVEFVEMTGGADDETTDELRRSVRSVMAVRPGSGNLEQWRRWTLATPGVGLSEAFVYPGLRGLGTITILPFGPPGARQIGEERHPEIRRWLLSQASFVDDVEVLQFSWVGLPQNYEMRVWPGRGYEPDIDTGGAPIELHPLVASTERTLQLAHASDVSRFQAGDRVVVPLVIDGFPVTEERVVTSATDSGFDNYRVNLDRPLPAAPEPGERIYSGGPLYAAIQAAMAAYHDELGPGDTSPPSRWPASIDTYQGDIVRAEIYRRVKSIPGVRDFELISPTSNVKTPALFVQRLGQIRITWSE